METVVAVLGMPFDDPQFWMVSAIVVAVAAVSLRRIVRSTHEESSPCANCPKAGLQGLVSRPDGVPRLPVR